MQKISNYARPRARIPELMCKAALQILHAGIAGIGSFQQSRCVDCATGGGRLPPN